MYLFIILSIVCIICAAIVRYGRKNYGVLEACGIPVVKPSFFLGSTPDFHNKVQHMLDIERYKKYGPIWGVYQGQEAQVHVCDPEMLRLILVKDFDNFHNRRDADFGSLVLNEIMDYLPGEKWKTVRSLLTPLFTTAKLKAMSGVIQSHAEEFAEDLKGECIDGRLKIDCRNRLTAWLIDMFARSTLGVQMQDAKNPNNQFVESFRQLMGEEEEYNWFYSLTMSFPQLVMFSPTYNDQPVKYIESVFRSVLEARRTSGEKKAYDFADLLNEIWGKVNTEEYQKLGITEATIISQAVNFFLGGYETSGTILSHLFYYLAKYSEAQELLHEEIDRVYKKYGKFDHEAISDEHMPYLTACINEALRLAPSLFRPERICTKDWSYEGITIRQGTVVMVPVWAAHRNPDIYPDPEEFKPERFLPENKGSINPFAFLSFGAGPRGCIGTRFAYESLKLLTSNLMKNFRVEVRADTKLKYKPGSLLVVCFAPLYLDLVQRNA